MINNINAAQAHDGYRSNTPFHHLIWDEFWHPEIAAQLAVEIAEVALRGGNKFGGGGGQFMTMPLRKKSPLIVMTVFWKRPTARFAI